MPDLTTIESSWPPFETKLAEKTAEEWDEILAGEYKQADLGLYTLDHYPNTGSPAWWPSVPATSVQRPLAGLKIVDLTRIVAGPSIGLHMLLTSQVFIQT
ncbi:CoA-transferase family III domain [Lasallia pustulata]|uniref:CoA-transferase family III domain n=1 Tax=Lasallia pustulata TaxID=136370 RepID=A0A1W5D3A0_9LECA|nr:CoA-transferase family III domain [Lasallia pustulata]